MGFLLLSLDSLQNLLGLLNRDLLLLLLSFAFLLVLLSVRRLLILLLILILLLVLILLILIRLPFSAIFLIFKHLLSVNVTFLCLKVTRVS